MFFLVFGQKVRRPLRLLKLLFGCFGVFFCCRETTITQNVVWFVQVVFFGIICRKTKQTREVFFECDLRYSRLYQLHIFCFCVIQWGTLDCIMVLMCSFGMYLCLGFHPIQDSEGSPSGSSAEAVHRSWPCAGRLWWTPLRQLPKRRFSRRKGGEVVQLGW